MVLKLAGQDYLRAPHGVLSAALAAGPMAETNIYVFGRVSLVLSYAGITEFLKDADRFTVDARKAGHSSAFGMRFLPKSMQILAENLLTLDEPDHTRLRRLSDAPFRKLSIDALRLRIEAQCAALLADMERSGNRDLVTGLCRPLPLQVICDLLGLSGHRREALTKVFAGMSGGSTIEILRLLMKTGWVQDEFRKEFADVRAAPRAGLITELVHAQADGGRMSEDELIAMVFILFAAGHETTTHFISSTVWTLLNERGLRDQVAAMDEDAQATAVDEFMRFCGPVQFTKPRYPREDTEFLGVALRRGKPVCAALAAGNLDPAAFNAPLTLDLARRPNRHLGWGWGPHLCLGLHLAKAECEIAVRQLLAKWPGVQIDGDPMKLPWSRRQGVRGLVALPLTLKS